MNKEILDNPDNISFNKPKPYQVLQVKNAIEKLEKKHEV
jgi:hypothetical protein